MSAALMLNQMTKYLLRPMVSNQQSGLSGRSYAISGYPADAFKIENTNY